MDGRENTKTRNRKLEDLSKMVLERETSLFIGAGFSMDSGGPGGKQLLNELKSHFGNKNIQDSFAYLESIIHDMDSRKEVEKFLKKYLARIEPNDNQKYLLSLPWKAVLTTNYDHVLDLIEVSLDGNRELKCIVRPEGIDIRKVEKLFCFKIFGDCDYEYPRDGYMVLNQTDRRQAIFRLQPFFKLFKELAMAGNIVYLGYSFEDNLVFNILADLEFSWKRKPWNGYAISPNPPSESELKKLEKYNVKWVEGDVESFVKTLKSQTGSIPTSYPIENKLMILDNIGINVSRETQINIRSNFYFLNENMLDPLFERPKFFFEGQDTSFYPYFKKWDLKRKITKYSSHGKRTSRYEFGSNNYVRERIDTTSFTNNIKTVLMGNAGSGKTIVANRIAYNWYRNGGPVIFIDPTSFLIDNRAIKGFIDEVIIAYDRRRKDSVLNEKTLRFLIVADNKYEHIDKIIETYEYLSFNGYLVDLLIVERKSKILSVLDQYLFDSVYEIPNTLTSEDLYLFRDHFKKIKLNIDENIFLENLKNDTINESFFALMYTTIKESQKPLKNTILDEYKELGDRSKLIYSLVSLFDSLGTKIHTSLLLKYVGITQEWLYHQIKNGNLSGIMNISSYGYIKTNHTIISDIIDSYEYNTTNKYFDVFKELILKMTKGNDLEEEFMHDLLIGKMTYPNIDERVNRKKIIDLYLRMLEKLQTKPLYHHLAIHYLHDKDYDNGKYYIKTAYKTWHPNPKFGTRDENLLDTEGRLELEYAVRLIEKEEEDKAWTHLDRAEKMLENAIYDPISSLPPFQGLARVYYQKGRLSEGNTKYNFCLVAIAKIRHLQKLNIEDRYSYSELERKILYEIDPYIDNYIAENIALIFRNSNGYALLAERELSNKKLDKALLLIDEGLSHYSTIWLLELRLQIIKEMHPKDIRKLGETLDKYQRVNEFDVNLAFELAKYLFYLEDYGKSRDVFSELDKKTKSVEGRLGFKPENILYETNTPISFKGIITQMPKKTFRGLITCYDLPKEMRTFSVGYWDIAYSGARVKDPVNFNIYFNYTGPHCTNVTKR